MVHLSVNVNKVATLRNSRGGTVPSVVDAVRVCVAAGVPGITVHPRADGRHITPKDVFEVAALLRTYDRPVEFNIEGDPRPDLIALVHEVTPTQCTLVPVRPGEVTSQAGWSTDTPKEAMASVVHGLRDRQIRVSLFVDPDEAPIDTEMKIILWLENIEAPSREHIADGGNTVRSGLRARGAGGIGPTIAEYRAAPTNVNVAKP